MLDLPLGIILGRDPVILNNAVILGRVPVILGRDPVILGRVPRIQITKVTFLGVRFMKNTFLITTLLATTSLATNAWADCTPVSATSCGTNCTYTIDANCHLVVQGPTTEGLEGSIKMNAFTSKTNIKTAEIKGNITSIGNEAFYNATSLQSVTIDDSVTSIGYQAFRNAKSLTSITIPDSVTSIGNEAFENATSLQSVTIGDSVTSIENSAFQNATSLTSITIPDSVTSIGASAFWNATSLQSLVIGDSVTSIGNGAFWGMPKTGKIYCPKPAEGSTSICSDKGFSGTITTYTKDSETGVYTSGGVMYASAEDMQTGASASCGNHDACVAKVQEYKEAKAASMAGGTLCQTKQGCLNLMDLVASSTVCEQGKANSYATCSAAVKNGTITGVNLAAADPEPEPEIIPSGGTGTGGTSEQNTPKRRIYTVQEATDRVKELGTDTVNFRIRYK